MIEPSSARAPSRAWRRAAGPEGECRNCRARGVPMGGTACLRRAQRILDAQGPVEIDAVHRPPAHAVGGKPTGFLCWPPVEWFAIGRADAFDTGITPDFIVVDGAEGGTGAAPLEFTDPWALPLRRTCCWCTNAQGCRAARAHPHRLRRQRSSVPSTSPARWRWAPTLCNSARGFMLRWVASRPKDAIPATARPA